MNTIVVGSPTPLWVSLLSLLSVLAFLALVGLVFAALIKYLRTPHGR
jgi:hypothetical protein